MRKMKGDHACLQLSCQEKNCQCANNAQIMRSKDASIMLRNQHIQHLLVVTAL